MADFADLASARHMLLTTFKPDGVPVSAVVHGIAEDGRAYFRAWSHSGTARNLRHTSEVQVTSCAMRGLVSFGPPLDAVARPLPAGEASHAAGKLARKYPVQHRFLMPLLRRARRGQLVHYELVACEAATAATDDRGASAVPDQSAGNLWSTEPGPYRITVVRNSASSFPWP
jgi:PPOX class probable F420-dependent enzyme